MLQAEKRLDRSQNHKLCTHQGPLEITWNLLCCDFLLTAIYSREEAACITIQQSPSHKPSLAEVVDKCFQRTFYLFDIYIYIILYIHIIYRSQIMPQVPQSYQLPACLMQLTGLRFRQGQQIAWHLVQRLKEIGELVSKHFNQSMTFYDDFVVNCRVKGDRKSTGTWHLNLRFSTSDFQATTALSVEGFLEESYNQYSRILWKRYQLTTPFIGSGWLWSRSNWTFILLALGVFVPRVEAGETILGHRSGRSPFMILGNINGRPWTLFRLSASLTLCLRGGSLTNDRWQIV